MFVGNKTKQNAQLAGCCVIVLRGDSLGLNCARTVCRRVEISLSCIVMLIQSGSVRPFQS